MTFATSNSSGTKFTITLAPSLDHRGNVDVGTTIDRFRRYMGPDAVFAIVTEKEK